VPTDLGNKGERVELARRPRHRSGSPGREARSDQTGHIGLAVHEATLVCFSRIVLATGFVPPVQLRPAVASPERPEGPMPKQPLPRAVTRRHGSP
jgi:hypothetical protein